MTAPTPSASGALPPAAASTAKPELPVGKRSATLIHPAPPSPRKVLDAALWPLKPRRPDDSPAGAA